MHDERIVFSDITVIALRTWRCLFGNKPFYMVFLRVNGLFVQLC